MFMMNMPLDFKIGETRDSPINGEPRRITWCDQHTLVIEPDDALEIFQSRVASSSPRGFFFDGDEVVFKALPNRPG
jgi:hypothetical protein